MITLSWQVFDDVDATSMNVYRSVPGLIIPFPNSLAIGDQLIFSATSPDIQTLTFSAVDITSVTATLNTGKGISAVQNQAGTAIIIRLLATREPRLKLYACTALTDLGIQPQIIVPGMNYQNIANVVYVNAQSDYTYADLDGSPLDSYYITSISNSIESIPSLTVKPVLPGYDFCVVETRFIDVAGRPVVGVEVNAEYAFRPGEGTDSAVSQEIKVYSDDFGRIGFPLMQGKIYLLRIPAIGYNENIEVPAQEAVNLSDLTVTLLPQFSPLGDPTL